jgi:phosphoribosyl-dephospho-CoA transferase
MNTEVVAIITVKILVSSVIITVAEITAIVEAAIETTATMAATGIETMAAIETTATLKNATKKLQNTNPANRPGFFIPAAALLS